MSTLKIKQIFEVKTNKFTKSTAHTSKGRPGERRVSVAVGEKSYVLGRPPRRKRRPCAHGAEGWPCGERSRAPPVGAAQGGRLGNKYQSSGINGSWIFLLGRRLKELRACPGRSHSRDTLCRPCHQALVSQGEWTGHFLRKLPQPFTGRYVAVLGFCGPCAFPT